MAYAPAAVCTPSRAAIMIGKSVQFTGVTSNLPGYQLTHESTFVKAIRKAGYRTGYFGKWGLGGREGGPWNHGFDQFVGQTDNVQAHFVFPSYVEHFDSAVHPIPTTEKDYLALRKVIPNNAAGIRFTPKNCPDNPKATCVYVNDIFRDTFFEFIEGSKPFFAFWAPTYPHYASYNENDKWIPANYGATRRYSRPKKKYSSEPLRGHAGRIEAHLDGDIGMFLDKLASNPRLDENTLVIFTSDNGPPPDTKYFRPNGGLRGAKRNLFEAGVRVPTMIRWKRTLPAGVVSRTPFALYELADLLKNVAQHASPTHELFKAWQNQAEIPSRAPLYLKTCNNGKNGPQGCSTAVYNLTNWQVHLTKIISDSTLATDLVIDLALDPKESRPRKRARPGK